MATWRRQIDFRFCLIFCRLIGWGEELAARSSLDDLRWMSLVEAAVHVASSKLVMMMMMIAYDRLTIYCRLVGQGAA